MRKAKTGYDSGANGSGITHRSTMDTTSVESAGTGSQQKKSRLTISSREHGKTSLTLTIFNQHMDIVTIEKGRKGGNR